MHAAPLRLLALVSWVLSSASAVVPHLHAQHSATPGRSAVVLLARGYAATDGYDMLIERTSAIARQHWASKYDHLIFHEGNLPPEHQVYVQKRVELPLQFISVNKSSLPAAERAAAIISAGGTDKSQRYGCPLDVRTRHGETLHWAPGYKAMCAFWYAGFAAYMRSYSFALRIDDDCILDDDQPDPVLAMGHTAFASSEWGVCDSAYVTQGMAAFFNGLSTDHLGGAARFELGANGEVCWANPYTNVMLVRLSFVHDMRWAIDAVAESECILSNRWGDLPLWGGTIELAQSKSAHRINMTLPLNYWHGSHNSYIDPRGMGALGCARSHGLKCFARYFCPKCGKRTSTAITTVFSVLLVGLPLGLCFALVTLIWRRGCLHRFEPIPMSA